MPVIVIGADTTLGAAVIDALLPRDGEVRAFVSDIVSAESLKHRGVKVAIGDVSDGSHIGGAALNTFCAVLIPAAAYDGRERSFAASPAAVVEAWAEGLRDAGVTRAIWVDDTAAEASSDPIRSAVSEFAVVAPAGRPAEAIAAEVAHLEALAELEEPQP